MMKIDVYTHVLPTKFMDAFMPRAGAKYVPVVQGPRPTLWDMAARIEIMKKYEGLVHVLTPTGPCLESYATPDDAAYLASLYNDEMAELVMKYPDKFVAAVACLPLNNIEATLKEIDRAINELGFKGVLMNTPVNGRPLDSPELMPIYERMSGYDLPIWIHPTRLSSVPDYSSETESKYGMFHVFGWPYETSVAMGRLVCSGIMAKYPDLKIITHHAGAMVPFFASRIEGSLDTLGINKQPIFRDRPPIEYFRMFYNDTALYGNAPGLKCACEFFGAERLLFATDMPYGPELGERYTRQTIDALEAMGLPASDKKKIYQENVAALLRLDM